MNVAAFDKERDFGLEMLDDVDVAVAVVSASHDWLNGQ